MLCLQTNRRLSLRAYETSPRCGMTETRKAYSTHTDDEQQQGGCQLSRSLSNTSLTRQTGSAITEIYYLASGMGGKYNTIMKSPIPPTPGKVLLGCKSVPKLEALAAFSDKVGLILESTWQNERRDSTSRPLTSTSMPWYTHVHIHKINV